MCWFRPNSLLKTCDWCLFLTGAEVGSAAIYHMRSTPFHQWKSCIRHNAAEVCSYFILCALLSYNVLWQLCATLALKAVKGSGTRLVFVSWWLEVFLSGICTFSPVFSWCLVSRCEKMNLTLGRSSYLPTVWVRGLQCVKLTVTKFMHNYTNC